MKNIAFGTIYVVVAIYADEICAWVTALDTGRRYYVTYWAIYHRRGKTVYLIVEGNIYKNMSGIGNFLVNFI